MTNLPIFMRPSTKVTELDLTQQVRVILSTTGAIVGEFARGPLEATYQSGLEEDFRRLYGRRANPKLSFAHDTATAFMTQSSNLLVKRVVNGATYAGLTVYRDSAAGRIATVPFVAGAVEDDYTRHGLDAFVVFSFDELNTGDTIELDITDGEDIVTVGPVTYADSHNETVEAFVDALEVAIATFAAGAYVDIASETDGVYKTVTARLPKTVSLDLVNLSSTGNTVTMDESSRLFDVFAENPGAWANDYGIRVSNLDQGVRQRFRLSFAGALTVDHTFTATVNGTEITVPFADNNDATLEDIATALAGNAAIASATVETVPGGVDNDRSMVIVAAEPGVDKLTVVPSVTGTSAPAANVISVMSGQDRDHTFTLEVFDRGNVNIPVSTFTVSLRSQLNNFGYQDNIEQVVNKSSRKALDIRVLQSVQSLERTVDMYNATTFEPLTMPTTISWMAGGTDGAKATSAEIREGWRSLEDRNKYPMNVLLNAGYTSVSVQKEMSALAEKRSDCIAILDAPSDKQGAQELRAYRLEELDIDTTFAAMYTPDVEIEDLETGERRFIPPSGPIGATYAYSDRLTNYVGAPAGLNRGRVRLAVGLRHYYTPPEMELLFPVGINYIEDRSGTGPTVMGDQTLQVKKTVLSSVHARRILNIVKTGLVDSFDYTLFEMNNANTRFQVVQRGQGFLNPMTREDGTGGLYRFKFKCDEDNNTPDVIDADALAVDVYLQITRVVKGIYLRTILTRTGANFAELIDGGV